MLKQSARVTVGEPLTLTRAKRPLESAGDPQVLVWGLCPQLSVDFFKLKPQNETNSGGTCVNAFLRKATRVSDLGAPWSQFG